MDTIVVPRHMSVKISFGRCLLSLLRDVSRDTLRNKMGETNSLN